MIGNMELRRDGEGALVLQCTDHERPEPQTQKTRVRKPLPNVEVECYHLASVPGPSGTRHHVIVDPSSETVRRVYEWQQSGQARGITVTDRAGLHSRDVPARVVNVVYSFQTLLVTTTR